MWVCKTQRRAFIDAPEAGRIDPNPSYLYHTSGFLSSDHGGGATGLMVRFRISIIPSELFEANREE